MTSDDTRPTPTGNGTDQQIAFHGSTLSDAGLHSDWYERWIYAGHASQIPAAGDYITLQIGRYPVILLRNDQGGIVAFNNSCRHRGSRICQTERGSAPNLVCPYHQWTYDLHGNLIFARNMMDEIDIRDFPLIPIVAAEREGLVFLHLTEAIDTVDALAESIVASFYGTALEFPDRVRLAATHRECRDHGWQDTFWFDNSSATCLLENHNISLWITPDHCAIMRSLPLNAHQTEVAIECFQPLDEAMSEPATAQTLLAQWGIDVSLPDTHHEHTHEHTHDHTHDDGLGDTHGETPAATSSVSPSAGLAESRSPRKRPQEQQPGLLASILVDDDLEAEDAVPVTQALEEELVPLLTDDQDFVDLYAPERVWDCRTQLLECTVVLDETHDVKTFTFKVDGGGWFKYKPGQFLTIELPTEHGLMMRTYTISSSPSRPHSLSITAKARPESIGTRWLFDNIQPGDRLRAHGPAGEFSLFNKPAERYLFISAGSGITPILSMTRWLYDFGYDIDVNFISCVHTPRDLLFRDELEMISRRCPNFRLSWIVTEDNEENRWTGFRGRFNPVLLGSAAPDYMDREVYCCGPESFMAVVRETLYASGFDMDCYHEEHFGAPMPVTSMPSRGTEAVSVSFKRSEKQLEGNTQETLLQTAKNADIAIPSACGLGVCGTCKVKVLSGETHMVHSGGISQKDIDAGYVLACCSMPNTDTVLDL